MKVSLIVEGAYPYVNGGVSNWMQQLMLRMPEVEFVVQCIAPNRGHGKKIVYTVPENCTHIEEIYLMDDDYIGKHKSKRLRMTDQQYEAFENLLFGETADWDTIIQFFTRGDVSLNEVLSGEDFLSMVVNFYQKHYERVTFTDFLWTMRSMYLPLFTCLKGSTIEADIYHSVSGGYAGIWACMQKSLYHKPFLMSEHGIYTREREEELIKADWVKGIYKDLWIKQFHKIGDCCYLYADIVTSLYAAAREFQIELGCDPEKTIITPNGIDPERFAHCPPKPDDDPFINVGALLRVSPIKDVKTMINAFALAKNANPKLKLWIMGDLSEAKSYAEECVALVNELEVKDVEFTGVIKPNEYVGRMDVLMLSSLSEGQPLSILEAFTGHKPFIATDVGNCRGLIEGEFDDWGPAGVVVPIMSATRMAEAILRLAADADLRKKMGDVGYRRAVEYYDEEERYGKYRELYHQLLGKG